MAVYFIQAVNGGPIKIGLAKDPQARLAKIQLMSPVKLKLLAVMEGEYPQEQAVHMHFGNIHSHGEWFYDTPELMSFISSPFDVSKLNPPRRCRLAIPPEKQCRIVVMGTRCKNYAIKKDIVCSSHNKPGYRVEVEGA